MPKRITADVDMQILADVGLGVLYKDVAKKYKVSASYISKLATGKKVPDIHIPAPIKLLDEGVEAYESDIEAIVDLISKRQVFINNTDIEKYLKAQITRSAVRVKVYSQLLKKYKGEK
jgi:transcriptional regulator with XRE-family HTH domain